MENPFQFIECKITSRKEFELTEGRQPTYALFYLKDGSFRLRIGEEETILRKGDCAIFTDDVDFSRSVITPISFVYLRFRVNPKCSFSLPLPSGKVVFRNQARFLDNIRAYESVMDAVDARALYYKEHLLADILLQLATEIGTAGGDEGMGAIPFCHDETVRRAEAYVREHLSEKLSVDALCRAVGTNPSTLNFKFRRERSTSVGGFITEERMRLARRLLTGTTFSVGEIATACGYENIYYFSAAFRKHSSLSPTAFREQYR